MMSFARVVLVCFFVSPCLLKHTLSLPLVPEDEDEAFNEVDFEEEIPYKDYDNVDEDPDFNPEDYYEEDYEDDDFEEDDDEGKGDEVGEEDEDDKGKDDGEGEEEDDDDEGEEEKTLNREKRDLDGVSNINEEFDPEEEELRAMEFEEDRIPVGKDVGFNPNLFDDRRTDDFDEVLRDVELVDEKQVDEDEGFPSRDDEFQQNDDPDSKSVDETDNKESKSCKSKESDTKGIIPL